MIESDVLVIGAGLSGLTCAALLAERGLSVRVLEACATPGGSCSSFRRGAVTYDLGAALLFGFDGGFSPHRYLMDELGEPVDVYRHEAPYSVRYGERRIVFHRDVNRFIDELAAGLALDGRDKDRLKLLYHPAAAFAPDTGGQSGAKGRTASASSAHAGARPRRRPISARDSTGGSVPSRRCRATTSSPMVRPRERIVVVCSAQKPRVVARLFFRGAAGGASQPLAGHDAAGDGYFHAAVARLLADT
ncbi:MAG TPA: FAD-dependent oxidoreductase, partial [Spirochaetales bacterium]|nr:FAD-dependent oxidoreductase [Spirochaetales bacterium]